MRRSSRDARTRARRNRRLWICLWRCQSVSVLQTARIYTGKLRPMTSPQTPPNWPASIPVVQEEFKNWCWQIDVPNMWTCTPQSATDVVTVCNWAKTQGWQVRARGIMHGWSPLTIVATTSPGANIILVDATQHLTTMTFIPRTGASGPQVTVGAGA